MNQLNIIGRSEITRKPDWVTVTMEITVKDKNSTQAMNTACKHYNDIQKKFKEMDLEVKLKNLHADSEFQNVKSKITDNWIRTFKHFSVAYEFFVEFSTDHNMLLSALSFLSKSEYEPEFNFNFSIREAQALKDELLAQAICDARHKADIITKAAGIKLIGIHEINPKKESRTLFEIEPELCVDEIILNSEFEDIKFKDGGEPSTSSIMLTPEDLTFNTEMNVIFEIDGKFN